MKTVEIRVEIKTGLPNYSGRTTTITAVAEGDEALDIEEAIQFIADEVERGWDKNGKISGPNLGQEAVAIGRARSKALEALVEVHEATKKSDDVSDILG